MSSPWMVDWGQRIHDCENCSLGGPKVVGAGNPEANLLIVGEAPGEDEILQGIPFVGKSGKDLRDLFAAANLHPSQYYLTNSVHCRPTKPGRRQGLVNRPPTKVESSACHHFLVEILDTMRPTIVLAVGAKATEALRTLAGPKKFELISITHPAARYHMSAANSEVAFLTMLEGIKKAKYLAGVLTRPGTPGVL